MIILVMASDITMVPLLLVVPIRQNVADFLHHHQLKSSTDTIQPTDFININYRTFIIQTMTYIACSIHLTLYRCFSFQAYIAFRFI